MSKCKHPPAFENSAKWGQMIFEVANLHSKNIGRYAHINKSEKQIN